MKHLTLAALLTSTAALCFPPAISAQVTEINFTEEDVTVPPVVRARINEYAGLAIQQHNAMLTSLQSALNNFETTMSFASAREATPDLLNKMASTLFKESFMTAAGEVPGLSIVIKTVEAGADEMERAARAAESHTVGEWIRNQRSSIDNLLRSGTTRAKRDEIALELELEYLKWDQAGRDRVFREIYDGIQVLSGNFGPGIDLLEIGLYEKWIKATYGVRGYDTVGMIDYRMRLNEDTGELTMQSVNVIGPFGDRVDSSLNTLLRRGTAISRPFDLKVKKRVCVYCRNFMPGGRSYSCGWLDERNRVMSQPLQDAAREAMSRTSWRGTDRFTIAR